MNPVVGSVEEECRSRFTEAVGGCGGGEVIVPDVVGADVGGITVKRKPGDEAVGGDVGGELGEEGRADEEAAEEQREEAHGKRFGL